jgi:hypothetical protein
VAHASEETTISSADSDLLKTAVKPAHHYLEALGKEASGYPIDQGIGDPGFHKLSSFCVSGLVISHRSRLIAHPEVDADAVDIHEFRIVRSAETATLGLKVGVLDVSGFHDSDSLAIFFASAVISAKSSKSSGSFG